MKPEVSSTIFIRTHQLGVTLIELLVSICIMAVLLAVTIPSFKTMLMNNRILTTTDALTNSLNYARNVALNQSITVMACPASTLNATSCGNDWSKGWGIISQPATGVPILLQGHLLGTNDPTLSNVAINNTGIVSISFDSKGIATTAAYFKVCDNRGGSYARSIEVLPTGFVQSSPSIGIAVWDGSTLMCP